MITLRPAVPQDETQINELAKASVYTKWFQNPSLSLKLYRKVAITNGEVLVAVKDKEIVGFIWVRPMKPTRMDYSTVYFFGVKEEYKRQGVGERLILAALETAKNNALECIVEDANTASTSLFKNRLKAKVVTQGVLGKRQQRTYTRWRLHGNYDRISATN